MKLKPFCSLVVLDCLRNKSWKPECISILIYMSKSTNTVVYFDWKTVIYIYAYGKCRTQLMLPNSSRRMCE